MIPSVWAFVLLALIAFSVWKLIGDDAVLDRPRDWALAKVPTRDLEYFITCPWCSGFWIVGFVYVGWIAIYGDWPDGIGDVVTGLGVWFGLRAVVGYLGVGIDSLEK